MKASETQLITFLNTNQQLIIPIYQRTYSWGKDQCDCFWKDLMQVAKNDTEYHFIGSIVYISEGLYNNVETQKYLVIDGQQRLTTISLLLLSMIDFLKSNENSQLKAAQIKNQFLVNEYAEDDKKIKLCLTQEDKSIFEKLVNGTPLTEKEKDSKIYKNFSFFVDKLKSSSLELDLIYSALLKIVIVAIVLDKNNDNPQLIFESLNSTGLDLSQFDLIRNYILMSFISDEQKIIYNNYWFPMEKLFTENNNEEKFDLFIRSYLTMKLRSIPRIDRIYEEFKKYSFGKDIKDIIEDVFKYSVYYSKIDLGKEEDPTICGIFDDIKSLKIEVSHPFLLAVYEDYASGKITKDIFIKILKDIESYVFRRAICGVPTNSLNKTFANLYWEIDKDNYLESFEIALLTKDSYRLFPKDNEFKKEIVIRDLYNSRIKFYLFSKLEYYKNKERVNSDFLSVEHIMPQELSESWKEELGVDYNKIHETYLHTLGNLTLTGYNSDMSNRSFLEKRDKPKGFKDSGLKLNKYLVELDKWGEQQIKERADSLIEDILDIWRFPEVSQEKIDKHRIDLCKKENKYKIDDFDYLDGNTLELFNAFRDKIIELDEKIVEDIKKLYIAYKLKTNFVDIVPQRSGLSLSLNLKHDELNDPRKLCRDVSHMSRWGNGDVEFKLLSNNDIDYAVFLAKQALDRQKK